MAVSKAKKKPATKPRKQASKASTEKSLEEVKEVVKEPKAETQPKPPTAPEPKPESKSVDKKPATVKQQKTSKDLVLKHKIGDTVSFQGKEWKVLVVVDKRQRERLRIECDGVRKAVWLEDLD